MNIEEYILQHIDQESELLKKLNRDTHVQLLRPRMLSGHLQGRILKMICRMVQPQYILELGTYSGYSALCLAEALHPQGELHTIEIDDEMEDFAQRYFALSPYNHLIHQHIGDAISIIPQLNYPWDIVFIDADKRQYLAYYEAVITSVRIGGFILADNTLWDEKVLTTPHHTDAQTIGIQKFNDFVTTDPRVERVILPLRDGLTILCRVQ